MKYEPAEQALAVDSADGNTFASMQMGVSMHCTVVLLAPGESPWWLSTDGLVPGGRAVRCWVVASTPMMLAHFAWREASFDVTFPELGVEVDPEVDPEDARRTRSKVHFVPSLRVEAGRRVSIVARNRSDRALRFLGAFWGSG